MTRSVTLAVSTCLLSLLANIACSQNYPTKPVRIVAAETGSIADIMVRLLTPELAKSMGQQFVVDNRPSNLVGEIVAKAPPDGYTLLVIGTVFWLGPLLQKTSYDPVRDFEPITTLTSSPLLLVVNASVPANSVAELIALAKAKPGVLNYASTGVGGAIHLATELFKAMAGINVVRINYKGAGDALNSVLGGETQLMFSSTGVQTMQQAKAGKLRVLAVSSPQPAALFPNVPTVASAGLPGYEAGNTLGLFAPTKTPVAIISRLNQEVVRALNVPEIRDKLLTIGAEPVPGPAQRFSAYIKADISRMGKVIKDAGLGVE